MPVIARPAVIDADFADGGVLDELLRHYPAHVTTDDLVRALVTSCENPPMSATDVHDAVSRLIEAGLAYRHDGHVLPTRAAVRQHQLRDWL